MEVIFTGLDTNSKILLLLILSFNRKSYKTKKLALCQTDINN